MPNAPLHRASHLLLDIEGTTCPVSFVADTLFPYAAERLAPFVAERRHEAEVGRLLADVEMAWRTDDDPQARALRDAVLNNTRQQKESDGMPDPVPYLELLIRQDRKLTALKDLQGLIWAAGYGSGELVAPLYGDVPAALRRWHSAGVVLAVYSSGSVAAQQLLYGHSSAGDLGPLFSHWFDTRIGPKQQASSFQRIAEAMAVEPAAVLFISDAVAECEAACACGMAVLFSDREGNPQREAGRFERIGDYQNLVLKP